MDHRVHRGLRPLTEPPRNPFRNEADAFRVLTMFLVGAVIVIAAAALIGPVVGLAIGLVLLGVAAWRAWGLWQDWGEHHRDTPER